VRYNTCMKLVQIAFFLIPFLAHSAEENPLLPLAKEMAEVEKMLRDDRHDAFVQIKGQTISDNLDEMISKMDKEQKEQDQKNKEKQQQQKQKQKQQQQGQQSRQQRSSSPLESSMPKSPVPPGSQENAPVMNGRSKWANLPPAAREELLQTYRDEIPERWRKRLEAYFLSLAAEEAEREKR